MTHPEMRARTHHAPKHHYAPAARDLRKARHGVVLLAHRALLLPQRAQLVPGLLPQRVGLKGSVREGNLRTKKNNSKESLLLTVELLRGKASITSEYVSPDREAGRKYYNRRYLRTNKPLRESNFVL